MRLFREAPDLLSVNAEVPAGLKAIEMRMTSSRVLIDLTGIRSQAEGLGLEDDAQALREQLESAISLIATKRAATSER